MGFKAGSASRKPRGVGGKFGGGKPPARRSAAAPVRARAPIGAVASVGAVDTADATRTPFASVDWRAAVAATVEGLHYELVDAERALRGLLRVTIDRRPGQAYAAPGEAITVEDCEAVTRQLQYALEVDGVDYARLEVSSPGLDRPLKREADYERFAGQAISLTLKVPFQGRKHYQGLLARTEAGWQITFEDGKAQQVLSFTVDEVREARLVPVINFKGSARAGPAAATDQASPASELEGDGA